MELLQAFAQEMYSQAEGEAGEAGSADAAAGDASEPKQAEADAVDADFEVVDEEEAKK